MSVREREREFLYCVKEREREREFLHFEREREGESWSKCALHSAFKFGGENECTLHSV